MTLSLGLDIGGTKIAGAVYDTERREQGRIVRPTPADYADLISLCTEMVAELDHICGTRATIGIGVPGAVDRDSGIVTFAANTPCLVGQSLRDDMAHATDRPVAIGNDADCAALSEAVDGAGAGHPLVFGLIMGTGVGGGLVAHGQILAGRNGLTGEFGHTPLPFRETTDGPVVSCACGQQGCIDKSISGPALARLHAQMTGEHTDATALAARAEAGDVAALETLDRFFTVVAKAMIPVIHMFDPDVIVVSGGLNALPRLYDEVPKRWGDYALRRDLKTLFVPAAHGALSGLRGAAWLGRKGMENHI